MAPQTLRTLKNQKNNLFRFIFSLLCFSLILCSVEAQSKPKPFVKSTDLERLELRKNNSYRFRALHDRQIITAPGLIRFQNQTGTESIILPQIIFAEEQVLTVFPDSLFHLGENEIRLLRGRINFSGDKENPVFHLGEVSLYLHDGEIWLEVSPRGEAKIAFRRGSGWLKDTTRKIIDLAAGQQVLLSASGKAEKPKEMDSSWKIPNYFDLSLPSKEWSKKN